LVKKPKKCGDPDLGRVLRILADYTGSPNGGDGNDDKKMGIFLDKPMNFVISTILKWKDLK
jgi:hypothetical protein